MRENECGLFDKEEWMVRQIVVFIQGQADLRKFPCMAIDFELFLSALVIPNSLQKIDSLAPHSKNDKCKTGRLQVLHRARFQIELEVLRLSIVTEQVMF